MSDKPTDIDPRDLAKRFRRLLESREDHGLPVPESEKPLIQGDELEQAAGEGENEAANNTEPVDGSQISISLDDVISQKSDTLPLEMANISHIEGISDNIPTKKTLDNERRKSLPAIDEYGMPLPGRVQRVASQHVSDSLFRNDEVSVKKISSSAQLHNREINRSQVQRSIPVHNRPGSQQNRISISPKQGIGCMLRMFLLAMLSGIIVIIAGGSFVLYEYYKIAATLPSVADLQQRASKFETTRIYDRKGDLLYEILDPSTGRRTFITLDKISPFIVAATIATEDKSFYSHPGFDWTAIIRAFWQNMQEGGTVSGASTITQQLARNLLLSPEERSEQSYMRKVREALLAAEITRKYSKNQILELYLNEFYYGNLAYGIEAASETYFKTSASNLDLAQASLLAGLPQAPSIYDVYHNREATRERQKQVLTLMYEASSEQGCIYVSNSPQKVCIDAETAIAAYAELDNYQFNSPDVQIRFPHWVNYVRSILENQFDAQTIYRSGFTVYTTIDPILQNEAELLVKNQVDSLADFNARDGALVAIRPSSGEILAMVGSADFYNDAIAGQVNMATSPTRQPGSSIKPITYIAAFEKGWTPASLIWDVPSEFPPSGDPNDPRPPYVPVNYDNRFHGPVTVRAALANSYNIPAVKALQFVGIYDDSATPNEDGMLFVARKLGISSLTRPDYGLSLTLGGGEVSLLELTGAYSVIANEGRRIPPVAISRILDHNGNVVYEYQNLPGEQVVRPEHAFLITSILSDNDARNPMFGTNSVLNIGFQAAAKTGTSNDFRDNWTLGYTPDIVVGVWIGNADYTPMQDITGLTGAAPIWSEFMKYATQQITNGNPTPFTKPSGIVDRVICSASGTEPSQWCSNQRSEYFAADQLPLPSSQDLWAKVVFDTWTGLRGSQSCPDFTKEEFALNVNDPWAIGWIQNNSEGKDWAKNMGFQDPIMFAPSRDCQAGDPHPIIEYFSPIEGQTISVSPIDIIAKLDVSADFQNFTLEYGLGDNPIEWNLLMDGNQPVSQPVKIHSWDLRSIPPGVVSLRITMHSIHGGYAQKQIHLNLQVPTPTPTITPTVIPTMTPTPTQTPTPRITQPVLPSPSPSSTPSGFTVP